MLRTRLWTGMCETLMPDVMVPEAHQNDCRYVRELSGLTFDSLRKNLAWWAVTRRTSKNHKTVKIGGWALARDNMVYVKYSLDTIIYIRTDKT